MSKLFVRYLIFIIGLYFLSLGIVLIVTSSLGTTPISSVNYVLSLNTPLTLGMATFIVNMVMIAGQLWLIRGTYNKKDVIEILLQIPFSFVFSVFIDCNMAVFSSFVPKTYMMCLFFLGIGCIAQAVGVVLELKPDVAIMSAEGFVKYASRRYHLEFGRLKVKVDVTLVTLAVALSLLFSGRIEGVREGSVVAALATGYIVTFLSRYVITKGNFNRLLGVVKH